MPRFSFRNHKKTNRASILLPKENKLVRRTIDGSQIDYDKADYLWLGSGGNSGLSQLIANLKPEAPIGGDDDELASITRVRIRARILDCVQDLLKRLRLLKLEEQLLQEVVSEKERPASVLWRPLHPRRYYVHATPREAYHCVRAFLEEDDVPTPEHPAPLTTEQILQHSCSGVEEETNQKALLFLRIARPLQILLGSRTMRQVWWQRGSLLPYTDEFSELLFDVSRIASNDYRPTTTEAYTAQVEHRELGMSNYKFDEEGFNVYALDGIMDFPSDLQKFANVEAVLFVVPLPCYDEWEDGKNRMEEALKLLRCVCANLPLQSVVVVLHKKEYFAEKIVYSDLGRQIPFADFEGPKASYNAAMKYIVHRFKRVLKASRGYKYEHRIHLTNWSESNIWEKFLDSSRDMCMLRNLHYSGFLGRPSDEAGTISVVSADPL